MEPNAVGLGRSVSDVFLNDDHPWEHALLHMADAELRQLRDRATAAESCSTTLQQNLTRLLRCNEWQLAEAQALRELRTSLAAANSLNSHG